MELGLKEIEDQLPGLEEFLCVILAKENLSTAAEEKRKEFVERFEVLKFLSPPLPPRPEGLPKPGDVSADQNSVDETFIARQRQWSRSHASSRTQSLPNNVKAPGMPTNSNELDQDEYDFVEDAKDFRDLSYSGSTEVNGGDEDLYEEPTGLMLDGEHNGIRDDELSSGTSYESYDEQEAERPLPIYENHDFHASCSDIALPRVKSKQRKKSKSKKKYNEEGGLPVEKLPNIVMSGELQYRENSRFAKWAKVFAVISDSRFLCYKNEKDSKPIVNFALMGYVATYTDSMLKRNHVIQIAHQTSFTLYLSADSKEKADQWMKHLVNMSSSKDSSSTINNNNDGTSESPRIERNGSDSSANLKSPMNKSSSMTNLSLTSSEGGSGDGVVQTTHSPSPSPGSESKVSEGGMKKSTSGEKRSKPMIIVEKMFNKLNFGKKDKTLADIGDVELDPETLVAGYVNICSELTGCGKKWVRRWCLIKHKMFECYKEAGDEDKEFSFPLTGCGFENAKDAKHELAIRVTQDGKDKLIIEPSKADQGSWLTYMIRESGCADRNSTIVDDVDDEDIYDVVYENKPPKAKFSHGSGSGSGGTVSISSAYSSSAQGGDDYEDTALSRNTPPPLPSAPPPTNRTWKDEGFGECFYENTGFLLQGATEDDSVTDDLYDDVALTSPVTSPMPASEGNNAQSDDERSSVQRSASDRTPRNKPNLSSQSVRSDPGSPRSRSAEQSPRSMSPRSGSRELEIIRVDSTDLQSDTEVVKCHTGPTIEEDLELIQTIHNPILSQLRQQKGTYKKTSCLFTSDLEKMEEDVSAAKKSLAQIRKKRAEIRGKKLTCGHPAEKRKYEEELKNLEKELEAMQKQKDDLEEKLWDLKLEERKKKTALDREESLSRKVDILRKSSFESTRGSTSTVSKKSISATESLSNKDVGGITSVQTVMSSVTMTTRNKAPSSSLSGSGRTTSVSSRTASSSSSSSLSKTSQSQNLTKQDSGPFTDSFSKAKAKWTAAEVESPTSPPSKTRSSSQSSVSSNVRVNRSRDTTSTSSRVTLASQKSGTIGTKSSSSLSVQLGTSSRSGARLTTSSNAKRAGKTTSSPAREKGDKQADRTPSPKGEKGQVQEKLQLWENISSTSTC